MSLFTFVALALPRSGRAQEENIKIIQTLTTQNPSLFQMQARGGRVSKNLKKCKKYGRHFSSPLQSLKDPPRLSTSLFESVLFCISDESRVINQSRCIRLSLRRNSHQHQLEQAPYKGAKTCRYILEEGGGGGGSDARFCTP